MYTIEKSKAARFLDVVVKQKAFVPGVGIHKDTGMDKFLKLSRGPSPHFKRGR